MDHALGGYPVPVSVPVARGEMVIDHATGRKAPVDGAPRAALHALEAKGRRAPGSMAVETMGW